MPFRSITPSATDALPCFGSALESNQSPQSGIGHAVLSGFDVTSEAVVERGISGHCDDEVVPAIELTQRRFEFKVIVTVERLRPRLTRIGIEYGDFSAACADTGDFQFD